MAWGSHDRGNKMMTSEMSAYFAQANDVDFNVGFLHLDAEFGHLFLRGIYT